MNIGDKVSYLDGRRRVYGVVTKIGPQYTKSPKDRNKVAITEIVQITWIETKTANMPQKAFEVLPVWKVESKK